MPVTVVTAAVRNRRETQALRPHRHTPGPSRLSAATQSRSADLHQARRRPGAGRRDPWPAWWQASGIMRSGRAVVSPWRRSQPSIWTVNDFGSCPV